MFTPESLMEAANVRARAANRHARAARADLVAANHELDMAIAEGRQSKVIVAREHTRSAEVAVSDAAVEMDVVEGLLDVGNSLLAEQLFKRLNAEKGM